MGTWGTSLFHDDMAADVRESYPDLLASGHSDAEAVELLRSELGVDTDEEAAGVFWLALAAVQWQYGRLDDAVRSAALEVIDSEADLRRWTGSKDLERRRSVLQASA